MLAENGNETGPVIDRTSYYNVGSLQVMDKRAILVFKVTIPKNVDCDIFLFEKFSRLNETIKTFLFYIPLDGADGSAFPLDTILIPSTSKQRRIDPVWFDHNLFRGHTPL